VAARARTAFGPRVCTRFARLALGVGDLTLWKSPVSVRGTMSRTYPLFVKRDLDGFFGLFIDNLVQLLLIPLLCGLSCGMTGENAGYVYRHIIPGAGVSILVGNLFYAWQAHRLAARTGRSDICALPYGINTPSLLVYIAFVMAPVYQQTGDPRAAWRMGLLACLGSGVIELLGAGVAGWLRRHTPRAALLSTLSGIAIGFIAMTFALEIFHRPYVGMLPLAVLLLALFARWPFPLGLPGGLVALLVGTAAGWLLPASLSGVNLSVAGVREAVQSQGWYPPLWAGEELRAVLNLPPAEWIRFLSVIILMGLFNIVGSLQNIESAAASGDEFPTAPSMAANGLGTIAAALFGSCFPTTIYIGHPGWKALGSRAGYSTLNGLAMTAICLTGTLSLIGSIVPVQAGMPIVFWVGIIITAQAFQATPAAHAPAVAMGLFPAIAAWGSTVVEGAFRTAGGQTVSQVLSTDSHALVNGFLVHGLIALERGSIFCCMLVAAIAVFLIERKFFSAAACAVAAGLLASVGLMHSFQVQGNTIDYLFHLPWPTSTTAPDGVFQYRAHNLAIGYFAAALLFAWAGWQHRIRPRPDIAGH